MKEIVFAFFASLGIILILIRLFDFIFYRKFDAFFPLIVDLRKKTEDEILEILEIIASVRNTPCGKKSISCLIVLIESYGDNKYPFIRHYLNAFSLPGSIFEAHDVEWSDLF